MSRQPDPADVLARLGRTARARDLVEVSGRREVALAVREQRIIRVARGHYALPGYPDPRLAAARARGVVSHSSAAQLWGLAVLSPVTRPDVTVPRKRKPRPTGANLHWMDLAAHETVDGVTSPLRTVTDCARTLEFPFALAIADSALRQELVGPAELRLAADALRGAGQRRAREVARWADGRAGSGLESVLRARLTTARVTGFVPQVRISDGDFSARVDLADVRRRIVLEADSFEHHGGRAALARDCKRYDELAVRGWLVLRFAWEQVMYEPEWTIRMVREAVSLATPAYRRTGRTADPDRLSA